MLTIVSVAECTRIQSFISSRGKAFQRILGLSLVCKAVKCSWKSPYQNFIIMSLFETLNSKAASNTSGSDVGKQFLAKITKGGGGRMKGINRSKYCTTVLNLVCLSVREGFGNAS